MIANGWAAVRVRRVNPPEQERALLRTGQRARSALKRPNLCWRRCAPNCRHDHAAPRSAPPKLPQNRSCVQSHPRHERGSQHHLTHRKRRQQTFPSILPTHLSLNRMGRLALRALITLSRRPDQSQVAIRFKWPRYHHSNARLRSEKSLGASVALIDGLWRVRFGPYPNRAAADDGLCRAAAAGFNDARIVVND